MTPNIADIIRHHVSLEVRCLDRLYLHAYAPKLQTSGGLCYFLTDHLGYPIPSPALLKPMRDRFIAAVDRFVECHATPVVEFESGQDKDAIANTHRARKGQMRFGVEPGDFHFNLLPNLLLNLLRSTALRKYRLRRRGEVLFRRMTAI